MKALLNVKTIVILMLVVLMATAGCSRLRGEREYELPILLSSTVPIGSIQFEVICSGSEVTVAKVKKGPLSDDAILEFNSYLPGRTIIGIVNANGIQGEGELVILAVKVKGSSSSIPIALENVITYSATTLKSLPCETVDGSINPKSKEIKPPTIRYVAAQP